jgi:hypothetical protein
MSDKSQADEQDKAAVTLPGTVKKVIPTFHPSMPERLRFPSKAPTTYIERFGLRIL